MKCKNWSNVFLGITCALCIFIAFLVFIVALIYMSVFVISAPPNSIGGGCSKMDQYRGIECAPKIEQLSIALERIETESQTNFGKFQDISYFCNTTLACVAPIKCKSISQEYEFVKNSCKMFEMAANDVNFCLKKLQKRLLHGISGCFPLQDTPKTSESEIMCQLPNSNRECSEMEILNTCGMEIRPKMDQIFDLVLELYECRKY